MENVTSIPINESNYTPDDTTCRQSESTKIEVNELSCENCDETIAGTFYENDGEVICVTCKEKMENNLTTGSDTERIIRAVAFGVPAAVVGGGIYFALTELTGYEFGLVAIIIGLLVGGAVRLGARHKGGWTFQLLAILLTYCAIVATYIPHIPGGIEAGIWAAFFSPFKYGLQNIMGTIIISIGLYEAWMINKRAVLEVKGPFELPGNSH